MYTFKIVKTTGTYMKWAVYRYNTNDKDKRLWLDSYMTREQARIMVRKFKKKGVKVTFGNTSPGV